MSRDDLRSHFGSLWAGLGDAKQSFDPRHLHTGP